MPGWMIALIAVACVIAFSAVAFLVGSLIAVHLILGRHKVPGTRAAKKKGYTPDMFGVDIGWFDELKDNTEQASITSFDGLTLRAKLIKNPNGAAGRVAICCHGYCATPRSMQVQARLFYDKGFDVLLPAMRGHDASDGKIGMAWLDRFDLLRWIDKIIELYGKSVSIALAGTSMGGATVIAASGMNPPAQVKCVIDDCGFSSQRDEYYACVKSVPLPKALAVSPLAVGVRLVHGYSIYDADIVPLARSITIPALFFHGERDAFVPLELGKKLYEACGSPDKSFLSVPDAAHACAYVKAPEKYTAAFTEFVDKVFG